MTRRKRSIRVSSNCLCLRYRILHVLHYNRRLPAYRSFIVASLKFFISNALHSILSIKFCLIAKKRSAVVGIRWNVGLGRLYLSKAHLAAGEATRNSGSSLAPRLAFMIFRRVIKTRHRGNTCERVRLNASSIVSIIVFFAPGQTNVHLGYFAPKSSM